MTMPWRRLAAWLAYGQGPLARLHRDERGSLLDYALVMAAITVPLIVLMEYMLEILSDYFGMIAYYVTWPFL
ncbi:MAG: hypothetical protein NT049_12420 [Planctomycetota bacterium]|nr:hypothetical protein [Planctomycetota bacterium]